MLVEQVIQEVRAQTNQVRRAPFAFALFVLLGALASWQASDWAYRRQIESLREQEITGKQRLLLRDEQIKELQGRPSAPQTPRVPSTSVAAGAAGQLLKRDVEKQSANEQESSFSELLTPDLQVNDFVVTFKAGTDQSVRAAVAEAVGGQIRKQAKNQNIVIIRIEGEALDRELSLLTTFRHLPSVATAAWAPALYERLGSPLAVLYRFEGHGDGAARNEVIIRDLRLPDEPKAKGLRLHNVLLTGIPTFVVAMGFYVLANWLQRRRFGLPGSASPAA